MFSMPGMSEWIIILVIVLIFFGAGKLPSVMKQFGRGIREFKDAAAGEEASVKADGDKKGRTPQIAEGDDLDDEDAASVKEEARKSRGS